MTPIPGLTKVRVKVAQYFTLSSVCSVKGEGGNVLSKQLRVYFINCGFILMLINQTEHTRTAYYTQELSGKKRELCDKIRKEGWRTG